MARVLKPIAVPSGVEVSVDGQRIAVKGKNGTAELIAHEDVEAKVEGSEFLCAPRDGAKNGFAMVGTTKSLVNNMMVGVSTGFERKLELVGVGYRAQAQGNTLNLTLGLSHPVNHPVPEGITIETPSNTEIVVKGADKQQVGQVAAEIRSYRPPEPYKGKGIRYSDERIVRKEAKKK